MAYTTFTPETQIEEAQDGRGFRIYDKSIWGTGDSNKTESCIVSITYINDQEEETVFDDLELIVGESMTKFNMFLSTSGYLIESSALTVDGEAIDEIFPDGYYDIVIYYTDGTYSVGSIPYYRNTQAFLAKYRCMKRTMPSALLEWPITPEIRTKNYDIYTLGLYLDAAEDAADLGKKVQFRKFIALIRGIIDYYSIPEPW